MVEIYCPYTSERLIYVLNYIFTERLGIPYLLHQHLESVGSKGKLLINYSDTSIAGSLQIIPQGILFEEGIRYLVFDLKQDDDINILIKKPENELYFDLFASVFYVISRYEEYLMFSKDEHHRFKHEDSCLFQGHCLHIPLVDIWLDSFKNLLMSEFGFSDTDFRKKEFTIEPTLDIDSVFAYKGRPFYRHLAAMLRDLLTLRFVEIAKRISVMTQARPDPNDNFDFQLKTLEEKGLKAIYFFQVGPYGRYDKNISPTHQGFIDIIKKVKAAGHTIGLHPSYQSNGETKEILEEKKILESIIGEPVLHSRQHFLRFEMPKTYRHLIDCGIQKEYSMGYSDINGFRAGTAFPFYWFDLVANKSTALQIVPFCMMDVAYKQFAQLSPQETISQSQEMIEHLKTNGSAFCFIFHNESLSEHRGWKGWRAVFKYWVNG